MDVTCQAVRIYFGGDSWQNMNESLLYLYGDPWWVGASNPAIASWDIQL